MLLPGTKDKAGYGHSALSVPLSTSPFHIISCAVTEPLLLHCMDIRHTYILPISRKTKSVASS
jgi:hypothetical protein